MNRMFPRFVLSLAVLLFLGGCFDAPGNTLPAPVDSAALTYQARAGVWHEVEAGDNLYSIAFRYDKNPEVIREQNPGRNLALLQVGQRIFIPVHNTTLKKSRPTVANPMSWLAKAIKPTPAPRSVNHGKLASGRGYIWPLRGQILQRFSPQRGQKGVDIAAQQGAAVKAVAAGKVVFSGRGIAGFGNLILVQHRFGMLSAYAYNERAYVRMGQYVVQGQVIAAVGRKALQQYALHFELRRNGMPVNPLVFLP